MKALRAGPGHGGDHLHNLLKFVTMRTERVRVPPWSLTPSASKLAHSPCPIFVQWESAGCRK